MNTPQSAKSKDRAFRKHYLKYMKPVWRNCFWSRPFGHKYDLVYSGTRCCMYCFRPEQVNLETLRNVVTSMIKNKLVGEEVWPNE